MNEKIFFGSGEFAKLCNTTKETLRHYERIGLLTPEIGKENGYRYYTVEQFEQFESVELLKEAGYSLSTIKSIIDTNLATDINEILKKGVSEIDKYIRKLTHLKQVIQSRIEQSELAKKMCSLSVTLQNLEETPILISDHLSGFDDRKSYVIFSEFFYQLNPNGIYENPVGTMLSTEDILRENYENINHAFTYDKVGVRKKGPSASVKPSGLYAVLYSKGLNRKDAYRKIRTFIMEHNLKIGAYAYEEQFSAELVNGSFKQIIKISVEVISEY